MKLKTITCAIVIALASTSAFAAKPTKFFDGEPVTLENGSTVETSIVECSGGKQFSLTEEEGQWCFAGDEKYCHKNKMKVAKKACKS